MLDSSFNLSPQTAEATTVIPSALQCTPTSLPESSPSLRPLVSKRRLASELNVESNDLIAVMKLSILQEEQRREEDARRREADEF